MISLKKVKIPKILNEKADSWKKQLLEKDNPSDYVKRRYAHPNIKKRLLEETSEKCAYCESKLTHIAFGHIDHIHPKSKFPELTFCWENLTLACELCNNNKGSYFDIKHNLLNPYIDNINNHLVYWGNVAVGISTRGEVTINQLDLNRPELFEQRNEALLKLKHLISLYNNLAEDNPVKEFTRKEIEEQLKSDKEYSLVVLTAYETTKAVIS